MTDKLMMMVWCWSLSSFPSSLSSSFSFSSAPLLPLPLKRKKKISFICWPVRIQNGKETRISIVMTWVLLVVGLVDVGC